MFFHTTVPGSGDFLVPLSWGGLGSEGLPAPLLGDFIAAAGMTIDLISDLIRWI